MVDVVGGWAERLRRPGAQALYLHVPFCAQKCAYCDFASCATRRDDPLMGAYARALAALVREAADVGLLEGCATAYVGGGTPTLLGAEALGGLVSVVMDEAPGTKELTCEANPDSLDDDVLCSLAASGATRLSVGVQSLEDGELVALGRLHDARTAVERVEVAVRSGLRVSADLMCATPGQTDVTWEMSLRRVLSLGVGHVSVYPLQIEEGTPLAQAVGDDDPPWNAPEVQAARMERAAAVLADAGLARYEVASYALAGLECRHNEAYWTGRPYLGLGTGASSMLTRQGYERLRLACPQLPEAGDATRIRLSVTSDAHEVARGGGLRSLSLDLELLDEAQAAVEDLMLGMRMARGVGPGLLSHAKGALGAAVVDEALERCLARGLATWCDGRLVPTEAGWLLGNELYGELWSLAPGEVRTIEVRGSAD